MIKLLSAAQSPDPAHCALPHILLVIDQLPKTLGGGERIALKLAGLLPSYGYRASLLTFAADEQCAALENPPCPIYLLPLCRTYDLNAIRAAFDLKHFLKQQQIQLVQTFFESSDIWAGFVTKSLSNAKLIWSRRDMGILRTGKHHRAYRLMAGLPDAVFAVSDQVRQHAINIDRVAPARVHTIYNGLDLDDWQAPVHPAANSSQIHIATVGNIRRVKGHDLLIKAAAQIARQHPTATFSIAGSVLEPAYFVELEELVRTLGLQDQFHFAGNITNLREYLSSADIFVLPSRSEGFSNAIIEAMAASLPVVATDVGGNAEAIQDGVNGLIVPPDDEAKLSEAILKLLADMPRARQMGAAGRVRAAENFTTEAMMQRITSVYNDLLRSSTAQSSLPT